MDAETRQEIEQVELELQPVGLHAGPSGQGGDATSSLQVRAQSEHRRRLSSRSRARNDVPGLGSLTSQNEEQPFDQAVFEVLPEEEEFERKPASIASAASVPSTTLVSQTQADSNVIHTAANSREGLHNLARSQSTSGFVDANGGELSAPVFQQRPAEIPSLFAEFLFVLICSTGQLLFGFLQGGMAGLQLVFIDRLGIAASQAPWLQGAFLLANGLSVIVSGPLADMVTPKWLMCGAFAFQTIANLIGVFSLDNKYVFFCVRGAQGLSVGVLVSSSISVLGRVYKPGLRKTRVFSIMAAAAPLGFWVGALQGGALSKDPKWIFAMNTVLAGMCCAAGLYAIPNVHPAMAGLSFRSFDMYGSALAVVGCALLVAGLTQGPSASWQAYTIVIVILGLAALVAFFFVEQKVRRPLLPPALWRVPGFAALIFSYFLGFGSFMAWQFYAIQFWLKVQKATPLQVALYLTPNAIFGVLATFIVSRIAHLVHGHWILAASMLAFALGPVFFLPQSPTTTYWALSAPGIALVTFGPDLSFAAASIFVTSSVAKHYQGSAGSLLVTVQNLSAAIMTSLSDTIGERMMDHSIADPSSSLKMFHSIWWFDFAASLTAAFVTLLAVRIPKTVEKEHEQ